MIFARQGLAPASCWACCCVLLAVLGAAAPPSGLALGMHVSHLPWRIADAALAVLMAGLAWWWARPLWRDGVATPWRIAMVAAATGLWAWAVIFGVQHLDPTGLTVASGWCSSPAPGWASDPMTHILGWHCWRDQSLAWPPGRITGYAHPEGTSLLYTDAVPLVALLLRPFSALLPDRCQYLGLVSLAALVAQAVAAALLVRRLAAPNRLAPLIAAVLATTFPVMVVRAYLHTTLLLQVVVVVSLALVLRPARQGLGGWRWPVLLGAAALVHPYLLAMALALLAARLGQLLVLRRTDRREILAVLVPAGLAVAIGLHLAGAGVLPLRCSGGEGYGWYTGGLDALINPARPGRSLLLPVIPTPRVESGWEGYAYLGAGVLGLVLAAGILAWRHRGVALPSRLPRWPLVAVLGLMALFAITPVIDLGPWRLCHGWGLIDLPGFRQVGMVLRSSGRFLWPLAWILMILGCVVVARRLPPRRAALVLGLGLLVQLADQAQALIEPPAAFRRGASQDLARARDPIDQGWSALVGDRRHLVALPVFELSHRFDTFGLLAGDLGLTSNLGYLARLDWTARRHSSDRALADLLLGRADPHTLYVLPGDAWAPWITLDAGRGDRLGMHAGLLVVLPGGGPVLTLPSPPPPPTPALHLLGGAFIPPGRTEAVSGPEAMLGLAGLAGAAVRLVLATEPPLPATVEVDGVARPTQDGRLELPLRPAGVRTLLHLRLGPGGDRRVRDLRLLDPQEAELPVVAGP